MNRIIISLIFTLISLSAISQERLKVMFYNLLDFPEANPPNRELILKDILDTYEPDIFMVCELQSGFGGNQILDQSLNHSEILYKSTTFVNNQSGDSDLQQLLYYRKDKFILVDEEVITTSIRDINKYTLQLSTLNGQTDPVIIHTYVTHLKSSQGGTNQQLRLDAVQRFTNDLENLDPNSFVIFAGDLNLYTSTEPAYIELLNSENPITMTDPIGVFGSWSNNINFQEVHTQSTRTSSGPFGAGAGGGLDDRFDFILISENMQTNPSLRYVEDTYFAYGNNGNCFNQNINDPSCAGPFSANLRNDIYNMSDHLPVVMELETDQEIVILDTPNFEIENIFQLTKNYTQNILQYQSFASIPLQFDVYSTTGQKITSFVANSGENGILDVSYIDSGVYFLVERSSLTKPLKFLKL